MNKKILKIITIAFLVILIFVSSNHATEPNQNGDENIINDIQNSVESNVINEENTISDTNSVNETNATIDNSTNSANLVENNGVLNGGSLNAGANRTSSQSIAVETVNTVNSTNTENTTNSTNSTNSANIVNNSTNIVTVTNNPATGDEIEDHVTAFIISVIIMLAIIISYRMDRMEDNK